MSTDILTATLAEARAAHAAATRALERAEQATRAAGVEADDTQDVLDTLTVRQINIVEDDGTLRMVIANSRLTGIMPWRGDVLPRDDRLTAAGILFANDEGTECGGLISTGRGGEHGAEQVSFLAFDGYEQNESFSMGLSQSSAHPADNGQDATYTGKWLKFADQPSWSLGDYLAEADGLSGDELQAVQDKFWNQGVDGNGVTRMELAEESDGTVGLTLCDGRGRPRLRLAVSADGNPLAEVLDEEGATRSLLPPTSLAG